MQILEELALHPTTRIPMAKELVNPLAWANGRTDKVYAEIGQILAAVQLTKTTNAAMIILLILLNK